MDLCNLASRLAASADLQWSQDSRRPCTHPERTDAYPRVSNVSMMMEGCTDVTWYSALLTTKASTNLMSRLCSLRSVFSAEHPHDNFFVTRAFSAVSFKKQRIQAV